MVEFVKNFTKDWGAAEFAFSLVGVGVLLLVLLLVGWAATAGGIAGFTASLAIALIVIGVLALIMFG